MKPACSASTKRSGSALHSASTCSARSSSAVPIALTLWRMRDSSSVGSGPRLSREVISGPACVSPISSASIDMSVSSEIAHGSPPAMAIWAGVRKRWRCVGERWRMPARTAVRSSGKGKTATYSSPSAASSGSVAAGSGRHSPPSRV
jgi:hypothetical protein